MIALWPVTPQSVKEICMKKLIDISVKFIHKYELLVGLSIYFYYIFHEGEQRQRRNEKNYTRPFPLFHD